jgi:hypothetical protein
MRYILNVATPDTDGVDQPIDGTEADALNAWQRAIDDYRRLRAGAILISPLIVSVLRPDRSLLQSAKVE